jgi:hypothetical protein
MKLISKTSSMVITDTYEIELTAGNSVIVIDYFDDRGKVIDTRFQDEDGNDLSDDPGLFEAVMEFLEEFPQDEL